MALAFERGIQKSHQISKEINASLMTLPDPDRERGSGWNTCVPPSSGYF
jgi:hypothetical protein